MKILWDDEKNTKLIIERGISFEILADCIMKKKYLDILDNPSRKGQFIFILPYLNYIYAIPFILDEGNNIILKTAYPSRKYYKRYGEMKNENNKT
jgi:uncharacterized DUF497 family protein